MTTATRTRNPLRDHAMRYLRSSRVKIRTAAGVGDNPPDVVFARVVAAPGDRFGLSVDVEVSCIDGWWECSCLPGENACAHRLAVQMATDWERLGGACHA